MQTALHGPRFDAPGSPSRGVVTCDSPGKTLVRWGSVRVVTTGWRRVVTTRLAQRCWGRARAWIAAVASRLMPLRSPCSTGAGQALRLRSLTRISKPCGRRFSGDEAGVCAHGCGREGAMRCRASTGLTQPAQTRERCCASVFRTATAVVDCGRHIPRRVTQSPTSSALRTAGQLSVRAGGFTHRRASLALEAPIARPWISRILVVVSAAMAAASLAVNA